MKRALTWLSLGWLTGWFFDPDRGTRRRAMTRDRVRGLIHRTVRRGERVGRTFAAEAYGLKQKATHLHEQPKGDIDDVTLAHKVETEIFRPADVPKGKINVNAENGRIVLRGEAETPEMIDELVKKARNVQGVRDVENLLHLPGTPAPMHE